MNVRQIAEVKLKTWMLKKDLCKQKDTIKIIKTSWNSGYSVSKNGFMIGQGVLNPHKQILENFKFNVFKGRKPKNKYYNENKEFQRIAKDLGLKKPNRQTFTIANVIDKRNLSKLKKNN